MSEEKRVDFFDYGMRIFHINKTTRKINKIILIWFYLVNQKVESYF